MHIAHDGLGRHIESGETLVEPRQRRRNRRVLVAQPMNKLHGESVGKRRALIREQDSRDGFRGLPADPEQTVSETVRHLARGAALCDLQRQAREIIDQHDPKRDRHRPKLADRERLHLLIGPDIADQHLGVETTVGMSDEGPGDAEDARVADERTRGELGKLPVIARRQVGAKLANLLLDEMIVVDEPFGRRRYRPPFIDRGDDRAVSLKKNGAVGRQAPGERTALVHPGRDDLGDGETARVLLKALDAE